MTDDPRRLHRDGLALQRKGRQEEAIERFDKAIEIEPDNLEIIYDKAVSLQMSLRFDDAISLYDRVLSVNPGDFASLVNKGLCFSNPAKKMLEEAVLCFDEALRTAPNDSGVLSLKGYALDSLGRYREAILCFDMVLQQSPGDLNVTLNKGISLAHLGKYDEAIAYFDRVLVDEPHNSLALEMRKDSAMMRDRHLSL